VYIFGYIVQVLATRRKKVAHYSRFIPHPLINNYIYFRLSYKSYTQCRKGEYKKRMIDTRGQLTYMQITRNVREYRQLTAY